MNTVRIRGARSGAKSSKCENSGKPEIIFLPLNLKKLEIVTAKTYENKRTQNFRTSIIIIIMKTVLVVLKTDQNRLRTNILRGDYVLGYCITSCSYSIGS